ncbi:hypothetical protein [Klebsiella quasipneumoniae]|uniref:hypothetical protein n=1 Tax=Klebsiella quasipneumoniae TaxID=1463165 RepID=UPI001FCB9661|nr:hypothetical protein [Klebsiella quasipneumoniae]MCJ5550467.1 hypothetical protein [Klebsiella quasipneumoniae]
MFKIFAVVKENDSGNTFFYEFHGMYKNKDEAKKDIVTAIMVISHRHRSGKDDITAMLREVKHG